MSPCGTANSSPYDYVTTVEYPGCGSSCTAGVWDKVCEDPSCYGVPLYRQNLVSSDNGAAPYIRMAGQGTWQRSSLTVNNGIYYIDSAVSQATQQKWGAGNYNVFQAGQTYYTFLLFAKPTTIQTYQIYVGANFNPADPANSGSLVRTRAKCR
jgi:cell migration-inducing and hyaluronan-binding protein